MIRRSRRLALSFGLLFGLGLTARPSSRSGIAFERFDANKDGKVTRDEVPERLRERFDAIDANKDGTISPRSSGRPRRVATAGVPGGPLPQLPPGVKVEKDIPYAGTTNPRQTLDLLLPEKPRRATSRCRWW